VALGPLILTDNFGRSLVRSRSNRSVQVISKLKRRDAKNHGLAPTQVEW
jgi:hypothetical protein